ncbi:MAG: hypothetical protein BV459_06355 [Thermoplasmata archaeon M11B2D]|nr:MAG: hypothetical protein BV459_06355 [Thermoplasmata archaeon M11B2D]
MALDFLQELVDATQNEYAGIATNEELFKTMGFVDTGSYALNALLSGSIHKGAPNNKIVGFAGEHATGKTFFVLACIKQWLDQNPDSMVAFFETESAVDRSTFESRGIDPKRVAIIPCDTIENFRTAAVRVLDGYAAKPEKDRPPIMFALDSLGMLSSTKEVTDIADGSDKRDMTKQQLIRGAFRVLTLKLGKLRVPMYVTNHIYLKQGMAFGDPREMGGGGGLKYAASIIVFLSKAGFKESDELSGAIITCTIDKGRFTREKLKVKVLLHHRTGLDRYYGLLDIANNANIVKKVGNKFEFPDGTKAFESKIIKEPETFFTEEVLALIDDYCQKNFVYGGGMDEAVESEDDSE